MKSKEKQSLIYEEEKLKDKEEADHLEKLSKELEDKQEMPEIIKPQKKVL